MRATTAHFRSLMALAIFGIAMFLGVVGWSHLRAEASTGEEISNTPKPMVQPEYDEKGALLRPEGYERWIFVGTSLGITYSEDAPKNGPGEFHSVYVQPEAFDYFVERGDFPEKTIFVMTNSPATKKPGDDVIHRHGHFAGPTRGLEVAVKDQSRFEDGWAYFIYRTASGKREAARPFPRESCFDCHAEHGDADNVFTQFYSVLHEARTRRTEK